ncbi:C4-dicarboxylate ABC transporter [Pusillimonas caeni]|uniref:tellurite resistance/C4-dicarboxylate transporter family protein n=1 Tax=Pusillimonas caeni TaxID=1348472 RepID=UPI000E59CE66|nr:tellurite resistance/C4-dicarboxylate transporter family protein [Pusillimonas caeni]TFL11451.1 C4-dicarboxylate ABC transporter [Pusillimonas caeni]
MKNAQQAPERGLASMSPASFGLVMATGIVSLAAAMLFLPRVAQVMFKLNIFFFAVLWALTLLRLARHSRRFFRDMGDHVRAPGYFTMVAGSGILGTQFVALGGSYRAGWLLWGLAAALWIVLVYAIFAALTVRADKPGLDRGLSGSWLLAVVATQSIAVLGGALAGHGGPIDAALLDFIALAMWLSGGMLYGLIMALIFFRYLFLRFSPADLSPSYWINMGAMAISTLAGTQLIANAAASPFLASILPFIKGLTLFFWAAGTWWIPLLLALGFWRHVTMRFPVRYDPLYWGVVFPFGMYAASTQSLIQQLELDFLHVLPICFLYAAMAAWVVAFVGLSHDVGRRFKGNRGGCEA